MLLAAGSQHKRTLEISRAYSPIGFNYLRVSVTEDVELRPRRDPVVLILLGTLSRVCRRAFCPIRDSVKAYQLPWQAKTIDRFGGCSGFFFLLKLTKFGIPVLKSESYRCKKKKNCRE